jgi:hypothetical protein
VRVCVHRLRNRGVSQHFGDNLGVAILRQQIGRARVPQGVEGEPGESWPFEKRLETTMVDVVGVHWLTTSVGECQVPIFLMRTHCSR